MKLVKIDDDNIFVNPEQILGLKPIDADDLDEGTQILIASGIITSEWHIDKVCRQITR